MNGKQRIHMALDGKMPDKTPIMLHNFLKAVRENGYTVSQFRSNPKIIADVFESTVTKYDVDGVLIDVDTALLADCAGVPVDFPDDEPARTKCGILDSIYDTGKLKKPDISHTRASVVLEGLEILTHRIGKDFSVRASCDQAPFSLAALIRGSQDFLTDILLEDEKAVFELLEYAYEIASDYISMVKKTGVDLISNGDSLASPDVISPDLYRKFAFPYEKRIVEFSHGLELPYVLHICGNTTMIIEDMIATGADCLELDYKTDIIEITEKTKGKTAFCGNIDPSGVISMGSKELVREKTIELLKIQQNNPHFILNAGCAIPATAPDENIKALIDVSRGFVRV